MTPIFGLPGRGRPQAVNCRAVNCQLNEGCGFPMSASAPQLNGVYVFTEGDAPLICAGQKPFKLSPA